MRAGMLDHALDAAERLGELEELRSPDELHRRLLRVGQERDHPAEVAHLPLGDLVAGVRGEPRVQHLLRAELLHEPPGDGARVLAVLAHPHRQGLDSAQDEPGVEGAGDCAERLLQE